ncbi:MAG TPA: hypothetical protein VFY45_17765 [Baekduia sp.]|nr:hypothetical protein [Baekduia sp.]
MKARTLLAMTISTALAALAPAGASAQLTTGPLQCNAGCVGSYSGKLVTHEERPTYNSGTQTVEMTWTWSETLIDLGGGQSAWLLNNSSAGGTVTYSAAAAQNCTFSSQLAPDAVQSWQIATPGGAHVVDYPGISGPTRDGTIEVNIDGTTSTVDLNPGGVQGYLVGATLPWQEMQTKTQGAPGSCSDVPSTLPGVLGWPSLWSLATPGDPGPCHATSYSNGETVFFPSSTSPVTVQSSCLAHSQSSPNSHATLTETLTFQGAPPGFAGHPGPVAPSAPQPPIAGPPTPRNTDKRKDIAASDLKPAAKDAIVPCTAVALGSVAGAMRGGVLTGLAKRGDASSPESLPDAGDALGAAWRDLCEQAIARLQHDYNTAHDPPVDDWHTFARLAKAKKQPKAGCARKRGRAKVLCELRADQAAALAAAKRAGTAAAAIETTVDRETAALAAGSTTVAGRQNETAAALGGQFDAAVAALGKAEASRTKHLKALGLKLAPGKAATKKGQALILKRLAPAGITPAALAPHIGTILGS